MPREDLQHKLNKLEDEHRVLDGQIARLMVIPVHDQVAVQRLKKRKLQLKDEIRKIQVQLIPDIIA